MVTDKPVNRKAGARQSRAPPANPRTRLNYGTNTDWQKISLEEHSVRKLASVRNHCAISHIAVLLVASATRTKSQTMSCRAAGRVLLWGRICQGPWNVDLRTPPGQECSNGSLLRIRRGHPGIFSIADCGLRIAD